MEFPIRADNLAHQVAVKSAVNPSLWASVVISLPLFFLASQASGWLSIAYFIIAIIPIMIFAYSYLFLLHKNPEYLRSEEYQLRMNTMRYMGDKDNPSIDNVSSIKETMPLENPKLPKPKLKQQIT